jgi:hypothetical protein
LNLQTHRHLLNSLKCELNRRKQEKQKTVIFEIKFSRLKMIAACRGQGEGQNSIYNILPLSYSAAFIL